MPIDLIMSPARPNNPFEILRRDLVAALAAMPVPGAYGPFPSADQHEAIRDHIRYVARLADRWLAKVGLEVQSNSTAGATDMRCFTETFTGAIDGNATFECDRAAEAAGWAAELEFSR